MIVLSRERYKIVAAVRGCHLANMPSEIPTPVCKPATYYSAYSLEYNRGQIYFLDRGMLEMPHREVVGGLAAQERRSNSQTTLSQFNASSSQPQRSTKPTENNNRYPCSKNTDRQSNETRPKRSNRDDDRPRSNGQRQASRSEQQSASKACVNQPNSHTHSTHGCNNVNPKGIFMISPVAIVRGNRASST